MAKKQKGYVLVVVMLLSFLMATAVLSSFSIVVRYNRWAAQSVKELEDSFQAAEDSVSSQEEESMEGGA